MPGRFRLPANQKAARQPGNCDRDRTKAYGKFLNFRNAEGPEGARLREEPSNVSPTTGRLSKGCRRDILVSIPIRAALPDGDTKGPSQPNPVPLRDLLPFFFSLCPDFAGGSMPGRFRLPANQKAARQPGNCDRDRTKAYGTFLNFRNAEGPEGARLREEPSNVSPTVVSIGLRFLLLAPCS